MRNAIYKGGIEAIPKAEREAAAKSYDQGTGPNSFAQQLANDLGTTVFALEGGYAALDDKMNVVVGAADKDGNLDRSKPTFGLTIFEPQTKK